MLCFISCKTYLSLVYMFCQKIPHYKYFVLQTHNPVVLTNFSKKMF